MLHLITLCGGVEMKSYSEVISEIQREVKGKKTLGEKSKEVKTRGNREKETIQELNCKSSTRGGLDGWKSPPGPGGSQYHQRVEELQPGAFLPWKKAQPWSFSPMQGCSTTAAVQEEGQGCALECIGHTTLLPWGSWGKQGVAASSLSPDSGKGLLVMRRN